ncbi:MAG: AMP-binding protein, partial [Firmicutes bacterium]|nr:AMP-binding protein [Bacillota bacterium]
APELLQKARQSRLPVLATYGLTETCSQVVTQSLSSQDTDNAGHAIFPTSIRIASLPSKEKPSKEKPSKEKTIGEILVKGPTVFQGYWQENAAPIFPGQDGWLSTGDLGYLDAHHRLHVVGRIKDLIVRGGENISPLEIEQILMRHPDIEDAAVIGQPDAHWGEIVAAVVVAKHVMDAADLRRFLRQFLAKYKIPTVFYAADELPRTASGKLQHHRVQEMLASGIWLPLPETEFERKQD